MLSFLSCVFFYCLVPSCLFFCFHVLSSGCLVLWWSCAVIVLSCDCFVVVIVLWFSRLFLSGPVVLSSDCLVLSYLALVLSLCHRCHVMVLSLSCYCLGFSRRHCPVVWLSFLMLSCLVLSCLVLWCFLVLSCDAFLSCAFRFVFFEALVFSWDGLVSICGWMVMSPCLTIVLSPCLVLVMWLSCPLPVHAP